MAQKLEIVSLDIDTEALISKMAQIKAEIDKLQESQKELTKAGSTSSEQFVEQAAHLSNLQKSYNTQKNVVAQLTTANKANESALKSLNDALGKENVSVAEASENNKKLTILRNQLNLATVEGKEALKLINQKLNENTEFIRENISAQEKQRMEIGNYSNQIKDALSNINPFNGGLIGLAERSKEAGGATNLLKQSFTNLSLGIGEAVKAGLTFIATPIGAIVTGVVAVFSAGKAIFDFNKGLTESNNELRALGVNANEISKVRDEIKATAETFDKDFKEIAEKANSLSKSFGLSMSEANDIIAQGLANGGAQNAEFLDSLGEYDELFAKAGYSAQEFINIVNTGYEVGIYSDKLPDALKEADLALKEQGKATRDALVNAFGASFTDDILKRVRTGEFTTKEALQAIANKSKEVSLTQQQQAQLTADVFKGAGEDAGGAMKILEAVNKAANKELSNTAKVQLELQESSERLNKAQSELFEVKEFGDIWSKIKTVSIDALASMLEYISDVKKDVQPLIDLVGIVFTNIWINLKTTIGVAFDLIKANISIVTNTVKTFFNFFKALLSGDFQGAINAVKDGFINLLNIVGNTFGKIKNTVINGLKSIVENISPILDALGVDVGRLQKKLDSMKSKEVTLKTNSVDESNSTNKERTITKDKPTEEELKRLADAAKKLAEEEAKLMDAIIKKNKEQLSLFLAQQGFKKKSLEDELNLEEQILNKKLAILAQEYKAKKISETAYQAESLRLKNDFAKKQAETAVALAAQELEDYKKANQNKRDEDKYFSDEKLIKVQSDNNALALAEIKYQGVRLANGIINQQEYNNAIDTINETRRLKNEEAEKLRETAKKEKELIDLENKLAADQLKSDNEFAFRAAELERNQALEIAAATKSGADVALINNKFAAQKKKLDKDVAEFKYQQELQLYAGIKSLFAENTTLYKAAATTEVILSTIKKFNEARNTGLALAANPLTAALAPNAFIQAGLIVAGGALQVGKIAGLKLAKGQVDIDGAGTSTSDSIPAMLSKGESVINAKATAQFKPLLQSINDYGLNSSSTFPPSFSSMNMTTSIDYDLLAMKISQANTTLPTPVVNVSDINYQQNQIRVIEAGASF